MFLLKLTFDVNCDFDTLSNKPLLLLLTKKIIEMEMRMTTGKIFVSWNIDIWKIEVWLLTFTKFF